MRLPTSLKFACAFALAIGAAACSSSTTGISTPSLPPPATPLPQAASTTAPLPAAGGNVALPTTASLVGSVAFPALASGSGSVTVAVAPSAPSGTPTLQLRSHDAAHPQAIGASALDYITITPSATVGFPTNPGFTLTVFTSALPTNSQYYLALYDPTLPSLGYQAAAEGPATTSTSNGATTLTFSGQVRPITYSASKTYVYALYAVPIVANQNLYVLDIQTDSNGNPYGVVDVYPTTATGNAKPSRSFVPATTSNYLAAGIAEDASGNIYVISTNVAGGSDAIVQVYAPGASGTPTPIRTIAGASTQLTYAASDSYVDGNGNLWVNNASSYLEFAAGANGNVAPIATLTGLNSGGIAVGRDGTLYESHFDTTTNTSAIRIFAPGSTGNASPYATLNGPDGGILTLDAAQTIYTVTSSGSAVSEYAQGSSTPTTTIQGANTGIAGAQPLAVDPSTGNLFVANQNGIPNGAAPILIFAPGAKNNVAPAATLSGSNVPIVHPVEITIGI